MASTTPHDAASPAMECSPTAPFGAHGFGKLLSPEYCRRTVARPVSYYALFK